MNSAKECILNAVRQSWLGHPDFSLVNLSKTIVLLQPRIKSLLALFYTNIFNTVIWVTVRGSVRRRE